MKRFEFDSIFDVLAKHYGEKKYPNQFRDVWFAEFQNCNPQTFKAAIEKTIVHEKYAPLVPDVKKHMITILAEKKKSSSVEAPKGCGRCGFRGQFPMFNDKNQTLAVACNCPLGQKKANVGSVLSAAKASRNGFNFYGPVYREKGGKVACARTQPSTATPDWLKQNDPAYCPWNPIVASLVAMSFKDDPKFNRIVESKIKALGINDDDFLVLRMHYEVSDWKNPYALRVLEKYASLNLYTSKVF